MIRRPPTSTLFPTRRSSDLKVQPPPVQPPPVQPPPQVQPPPVQPPRQVQAPRSEEHTSELQSQFHLVCCLLLENKKIWLNAIFAVPSLICNSQHHCITVTYL